VGAIPCRVGSFEKGCFHAPKSRKSFDNNLLRVQAHHRQCLCGLGDFDGSRDGTRNGTTEQNPEQRLTVIQTVGLRLPLCSCGFERLTANILQRDRQFERDLMISQVYSRGMAGREYLAKYDETGALSYACSTPGCEWTFKGELVMRHIPPPSERDAYFLDRLKESFAEHICEKPEKV
jgi:hypothetical protein